MQTKVCFENLLNSLLRLFQTALTSTTDIRRGSGAGTGNAHHVDCPVSLLGNMVLLYWHWKAHFSDRRHYISFRLRRSLWKWLDFCSKKRNKQAQIYVYVYKYILWTCSKKMKAHLTPVVHEDLVKPLCWTKQRVHCSAAVISAVNRS